MTPNLGLLSGYLYPLLSTMTGGLCPACHDDLRKGIFKGNRDWKSCPDCSAAKGEHVFRPYPDDFGTTDKRSSDTNPDGPQSYCIACRGRGSVSGKTLKCSTIEKYLSGRR